MNYRHHFHAGNFADVMKHALLVQLVRALQKKEKGFLYLDTHAGRGSYDLSVAGMGDSLARKAEWPEGIGRLAAQAEVPPAVADYLALVEDFRGRTLGGAVPSPREVAMRGEGTAPPEIYPGSPRFVQHLARSQDRLALCEKHPDEFLALAAEFRGVPRAAVHELDGYTALRAMLPPPERRALVLIDPPFEAQDEFAQIVAALGDGLRRLPGGVFAVWYPLTQRARVDDFFAELRNLPLPPTLVAELAIAGDDAPMKMKGCGLVVLNPPWQFDRTAGPMLEFLAKTLAQAPGGGARVDWLVPEK